MENPTLDFDAAEVARNHGFSLYRVKMAVAGYVDILARSRNEAITTSEALYSDDCAITVLPAPCGSGR